MVCKLALLLGIAAVVTATKAWNDSVSWYTAKKMRAHEVPERLHRRLHHLKQTPQAQSSTVLERAMQPTSKYSDTTVPRCLTAPASSSGIVPSSLPGKEHETLVALYHSLSGPQWRIKDNWMSSANPCGNGTINNTWYGVECAIFANGASGNSSSHVTGLALPQNNLIGNLPPLRSLQHLLHLDFSNPDSYDVSDFQNSVGGSLDALCDLGNLSTVLLAGNNLTGSIPNCIQSLANTTVLDLDYNAIQGTTPDELCRLRNLAELHLRGNRLQGTVPMCFGEKMAALRVLDYSNYNSDGSFGKQSLSGTLPISLCDLEHLESLLFQSTQGLNGTLPDCLGAKQPQLQTFSVDANQFHGLISEELCDASALEYLTFRDNALTGTVPSCLGSLSQLTDLKLDRNQFHGPIPEELCQLSALKYLYLYENALTGTLPSCMGSLGQLIDFELASNQFHGPLPQELCQASALVFLNLNFNALSGTVPSCLGSLSQLIGFGLQANQFHGTVPEELCQASALEYLTIGENALTGTVSSCLGSLSQLAWLDLRTCQFHGPVPDELCHASTLKYLHLNENALTGTIPGCLGSLSQLTVLNLSTSQFHGPIPDELCQASALEFLFLFNNALTGTIPSCLAVSFPFVMSMLVHENNLAGALPSEWALPSLVNIILSNNPKLSGSLPPSLFLQQAASNATDSSSSNVVLRTVVIEGTSIGGTLPRQMCAAPQLVTLAFSGNDLTGSLPYCISSLQNLQTLHASNNHLTGTLPEAINNMTSLTVLDLSFNKIRGRVPAGLGDISPNLDMMHLQLNQLSCNLPGSVLDWQASSAKVSFNLLDGNLFGCGASTFSGFITLSIQGASGLRNANEEAFDAYNCGNSVYVLPLMTIAFLALPVVVWLILHCFRGRLALQWRVALEWMVNPSTLVNELDHADRQIRDLALGTLAAITVAGSVALVLSLRVAESTYECEYMAAPTFANKRGSDIYTLSIGIGAAGCVGLVLGLAPWWCYLVMKFSSSAHYYGGNAVQEPLYSLGGTVAIKKNPMRPLEEDAEPWNFDAERFAEAIPQKPAESYFEARIRVLKLVALIMTPVIITVGPNVGYVLIVLSELALQQKVASEMAITFAKTAIGTLLVPKVAKLTVDLLVLNGALTFVRFRLRMVIATALSSVTMIVLPVLIVLVTDKRCLYYVFKPQPAINTIVPYSHCSLKDPTTDTCLEYATDTTISTYTPSFAYDGEVCVSAVISLYGPVFLGKVLLAATLPAGMETFVVPSLAPWCYRNSETSTVARMSLAFLEAVTMNVWPTLANAGVLPPDFSLGAAKLDNLAQRVVERAFGQVLTTLLVALTFGMAVPVVGFACAVAVFVKLLHHRHVLGQIAKLGRLEQPAIVPNLMGCTDIPMSCAVVVVVTVVLVWVCGAVGYFEPAVIGCALLIGLIVALAACVAVAWWLRRYRLKSRRLQAQSAESSATPEGVQMESVFAANAPDVRPETN